MLILVKESKVVSFLRDVPVQLRILISLGFTLFLFFVWIFFFYGPANYKIKKFRSNIEFLRASNEASIKAISKIPKLNSQAGELKKTPKTISPKYTLHRSTTLMFDAIHLNKLTCVKFIPKVVLDSKKMQHHFLNFVVRGDYKNMIIFFDLLKKISYGTHIKDLSLKLVEDNKIQLKMRLIWVG
ncbi:hypothetical protein KAW80_04595 [Candidatus Babeliales bacterium]|nr:hypothetical protein [Candidatus Babeliales bacterium]